MPLASRMVKQLKRSGIREILDLSATMDGVIHLEIGEPLFNTPSHITDAALEAARRGYTKYSPNMGFQSLRQVICQRLQDDFGLGVGPESVVITVGGIGALSTAVRALVDYGDHILIPDPGWPNYEMFACCAGAVPQRYRLRPEMGFLPTVEDLERALTPNSKVLILNSPSNPLGTVFPAALMQQIIDFAGCHDLFVLSDEVYEKIIFEGNHTSALPFDTDGRVVGAFSFSKTYAMTGWRVGYAVASPDIAAQIGKLQEAYVSSACSVAQKAAEAALLSDQNCVEVMRDTYRGNLSVAKSILDDYGIKYVLPKGAFYIWIDVSSKDSSAFAEKLLLTEKVAVAPGSTFGPSGQRYVRVSLASARESVQEGLHRLGDFLTTKCEGGS